MTDAEREKWETSSREEKEKKIAAKVKDFFDSCKLQWSATADDSGLVAWAAESLIRNVEVSTAAAAGGLVFEIASCLRPPAAVDRSGCASLMFVWDDVRHRHRRGQVTLDGLEVRYEDAEVSNPFSVGMTLARLQWLPWSLEAQRTEINKVASADATATDDDAIASSKSTPWFMPWKRGVRVCLLLVVKLAVFLCPLCHELGYPRVRACVSHQDNAKKEKDKELENVVDVSQHHRLTWQGLEVHLYPGGNRAVDVDGNSSTIPPAAGAAAAAGGATPANWRAFDSSRRQVVLDKTSGVVHLSRE